MNWDDINAVTQIGSVIAIVVLLVYLSSQIRQNTKVAKATTRWARSGSSARLTSDLMTNREIAETMLNHMNGKKLIGLQARLQAGTIR